jgi:hypothetical protein
VRYATPASISASHSTDSDPTVSHARSGKAAEQSRDQQVAPGVVVVLSLVLSLGVVLSLRGSDDAGGVGVVGGRARAGGEGLVVVDTVSAAPTPFFLSVAAVGDKGGPGVGEGRRGKEEACE